MTGSDTLIYRLLFNLTENAVNYNRPGGLVRISVVQEQEKIIIRVSDTGYGIPEEFQRSIFQQFFRVDKSRSREYGGVGLGLSLVWEIAKLPWRLCMGREKFGKWHNYCSRIASA